jgi:hypothetical protein
MKMSLEWHKQCLGNKRICLDRKREDFIRHQKAIAELEDAVWLYNEQINAAEERGRDGFDREKFFVETREREMTHDARRQELLADIKDISLVLTDPKKWARQAELKRKEEGENDQ